jgi:hypothetical protein
MAEEFDNDELMAALSRARPVEPEVLTSQSPEAEALYTRIVSAEAPVRPQHRGLVPQRHVGARRSLVRLAFAGGVAALVVGGVYVMGSQTHTPASHYPVALSATDLAYRTAKAVHDASATGIEYATTTGSGSTPPVSYTQNWAYEGTTRYESSQLDVSRTIAPDGKISVTLVDFSTGNYAISTDQAVSSLVYSNLGYQNVATQIQDELANGDLTITGSTPLDGQPATELTSTDVSSLLPVAPGIPNLAIRATTGTSLAPTMGTAPASMSPVSLEIASETLWVNPTTYLPTQRVVTFTDGGTITTAISWLPVTAGNLALLVAPIPSGYTEVSFAAKVG